MTSFGGTPIQDRYKEPRLRRFYLPVYPADHPDTNDVLTIAHGKRLKKPSYVNTKNVHELPLSILHKFRGDEDLRLEGESYRTLVRKIWKQTLTKHTAGLLSNHGVEPTPVPHYQSADGIPAIESTVNQENISASVRTPSRVSSVPRSLPISSAYGTFLGSSESALPRFVSSHGADGDGPGRRTWLERLRRIIARKDVKKYAIATVVITSLLAGGWYAARLIRSVVQTGIAIGRDVYTWVTNIPSTLGGAITRWVEALKNSLGGRLTAMWTVGSGLGDTLAALLATVFRE